MSAVRPRAGSEGSRRVGAVRDLAQAAPASVWASSTQAAGRSPVVLGEEGVPAVAVGAGGSGEGVEHPVDVQQEEEIGRAHV